MSRWFLLLKGHVEGPFSDADIDAKVRESASPQEILIWGKGLGEWLSYEAWLQEKNSPQLVDAQTQKETKWRYRIQGNISPWMDFQDLLKSLKDVQQLSEVSLCNDEDEHFRDIYEFPHVVDQLGITRRAHPRVPIMGVLEVELASAPSQFRVISISEGGLGITEAKKLTIGQRFKAQLKSPNLFSTINCNCEVVYVGQDGYAGIKFHNLNSEFHSAIIEYVKKFSEAKLSEGA